MTDANWTALAAVVATALGGGGLVTLVKVFVDRQAGVKGAERDTKRDMIADRDGLIQTLFARQSTLESRVDGLESDKSYLAKVRDAYSDHIDRLENIAWSVYRGLTKPEPPPARPTVSREETANHG